MAEGWTDERIAALETTVEALLATPLAPQVRWALTEYQALWERACRVAGALQQENETLRAIIADQDDPHPWDQGDERPW